MIILSDGFDSNVVGSLVLLYVGRLRHGGMMLPPPSLGIFYMGLWINFSWGGVVVFI